MSYQSYKYARVLISGAKSAVLPEKFTDETLKVKKLFVNSLQNKMIVKNITLFSDYSFTNPQIEYTGIDNVYNSNYSGNLVEIITGLITYQDSGKIDSNGLLIKSGYIYGDLSGYKTLTPINDANIKPILTNLKYPKDESIIGSKEKTIYPPYAFRNQTYSGIFSGTTTFSDYFYDSGTNTVSFTKDFNYLVTGSGVASKDYIVARAVNSDGRPPDTLIVDQAIFNGSGYMEETGYVFAFGKIKNVPLFRYNLEGFGTISGKVTGFGYISNTGVYIFNQMVTGTISTGEQFTATGYVNATGLLLFNNPSGGDLITISNELNNTSFTFIYSTEEGFEPPIYFNSLETLSNIINSGSQDYNIRSEYIDTTKMRVISAISGASGNFTSILGGGSENTLNLVTGTYLTGGISYYAPLSGTGIFSGILYKEVNITGYYQSGFKGVKEIQMTGILGDRPFSGLWNLFETEDDLVLNNVKDYGNFNSTGMFSSGTPYSYETQNYKTIYVNYRNDPNVSTNDLATLTITMNSGLLQKSIILTGVQP